MGGPWERYQQTAAPAAGPWSRYQRTEQPQQAAPAPAAGYQPRTSAYNLTLGTENVAERMAGARVPQYSAPQAGLAAQISVGQREATAVEQYQRQGELRTAMPEGGFVPPSTQMGRQYVGAVVSGAARGVASLPQMANDSAEYFHRLNQTTIGGLNPYGRVGSMLANTETGQRLRETTQRMTDELAQAAVRATPVAAGMEDIAAVGEMVPQSLAAGFTGPVGLTIMGGAAANQAYRDARAEGLSENEAVAYGGVVGGFEAATEKLDQLALMGRLGRLLPGAGRGTLRAIMNTPSTAKYMAVNMIEQTLSEDLNTALQHGTASVFDVPAGDLWDKIQTTTLTSMLGTPLIGAAGAVVNARQQRIAQETQELLATPRASVPVEEQNALDMLRLQAVKNAAELMQQNGAPANIVNRWQRAAAITVMNGGAVDLNGTLADVPVDLAKEDVQQEVTQDQTPAAAPAAGSEGAVQAAPSVIPQAVQTREMTEAERAAAPQPPQAVTPERVAEAQQVQQAAAPVQADVLADIAQETDAEVLRGVREAQAENAEVVRAIDTRLAEIERMVKPQVEAAAPQVPGEEIARGVRAGQRGQMIAGGIPQMVADATAKGMARFKPIETMTFASPIVGTNGAKLISYSWRWKSDARINKEGEEVMKRVSDWDQAQQNIETGRDIVHQFTVSLPNGEIKSVSLETAARVLGFTDATQAKSVKSIASTVKTIAKNRMQLQLLEQQYQSASNAYNSSQKEAEQSPIPEFSTDGKQIISSDGVMRIWRMPSGQEYLDKNMDAVIAEWRNAKRDKILFDYGFKNYDMQIISGKIKDLQSRITRSENKLNVSYIKGQRGHALVGLGIPQLVDAVVNSKTAQETRAAVRDLGQRVYAAGARTWQAWHDRMRSLLGKVWAKVQPHLRSVWNDIAETAKTTKRIARNAVLFPVLGGLNIPAFHGTPHMWEGNRADITKIGTGEGNQAYGWGLYFAGAREVAEHYRVALSQIRKTYKVDGKTIDFASLPYIDKAAIRAITEPKLYGRTAEMWRDQDVSENKIKELETAISNYRGRVEYTEENIGRLYEVDLAPTEDQYLDWDAPLSEQSEYVRERLKDDDAFRYLSQDFIRGKYGDNGRSVYKDIAERVGSDKAASEYLASIGIPGIRYLDATSRGKGEGSSNYVIFDDKLVEVISVNGETVKRTLLADQRGEILNPAGVIYDAAKAVYKAGATTWQRFSAAMRTMAGELADRLAPYLRRIYNDVRLFAADEGGAYTPQGGGGRTAAQQARIDALNKAIGTRRSKFTETVQVSPHTEAPVAEELRNRAPQERYQKRWNAQDYAQAEHDIAMSEDAVRERLKKITAGSVRPNSVDVIAAQILIDRAQQSGNFSEAVSMVEDISQTLTKLGQAVQAAAIWNRLTPQGILRYAQRNVEPGVITDAIGQQLYDRAVEIQNMPEGRAQDIARATLLRDIARLTPPSRANQLATLLAMAQLLNPKTIIRNLGGNTIFLGAENISKNVGAAIDAVVSLMSGKRAVKATGLRGIKSQIDGFVKGWRDGMEEARAGVDLSPTRTMMDIQAPGAFRNVVGDVGERILNYALRVPDRAAFTAAYAESLLDQAQTIAQNEGLTGAAREQRIAELIDAPTDAMNVQAVEDGLYRTFADSNLTTQFFTTVKSGANVIGVGRKGAKFGLGNIILNYPKVPANLLNRMVAYSPIGAFRSLYELSKLAPPVRYAIEIGQQWDVLPSELSSEFNQREFSMAAARAAVGSIGLTSLGAVLASIGILDDKDEDKVPAIAELRRRSGAGRYRINVSALQRYLLGGFNSDDAKRQTNDLLVSYDWAQPLSASMAMGANAADMEGIEAALSAMDTIAEQPLVSGLMRSLSMFGSTDGDRITRFVLGTLEAAPAAFVPTLLNQINQVMDNADRERWDPRFTQRTINNVLAKLPVMSAWLPQRSYLGEPAERYAQGGNNFFNVFFNPAFAARYLPKPEAELMMSVYRMTGEKRGVIDRLDKKLQVPGEADRRELSTEQWLRMNRDMQQGVVKKMQALQNVQDVNMLAKKLAEIITDERTRARDAMVKELTGQTTKQLRAANRRRRQ